MSAITIYKDIDDCGESFTLYLESSEGKEVHGPFLSNDTELERLVGYDWEQYVESGLDNRGDCHCHL